MKVCGLVRHQDWSSQSFDACKLNLVCTATARIQSTESHGTMWCSNWTVHLVTCCQCSMPNQQLLLWLSHAGVLPIQWQHQAVNEHYVGTVVLDLSFTFSNGYITGLTSYYTSTITLPDAYSHPVIHTITTVMPGMCHVADAKEFWQIGMSSFLLIGTFRKWFEWDRGRRSPVNRLPTPQIPGGQACLYRRSHLTSHANCPENRLHRKSLSSQQPQQSVTKWLCAICSSIHPWLLTRYPRGCGSSKPPQYPVYLMTYPSW